MKAINPYSLNPTQEEEGDRSMKGYDVRMLKVFLTNLNERLPWREKLSRWEIEEKANQLVSKGWTYESYVDHIVKLVKRTPIGPSIYRSLDPFERAVWRVGPQTTPKAKPMSKGAIWKVIGLILLAILFVNNPAGLAIITFAVVGFCVLFKVVEDISYWPGRRR